jgi:TonB family protein
MHRRSELPLLAAIVIGVSLCTAGGFAQTPHESPSAQPGPAPIHTCPGRLPLSKDEEPGGPLRVGRRAGITQPWRETYVRPEYPHAARAEGVKGIVILEALIDRNGNVRSTQILRSIPPLDQAAADAVCRWEFTPAIVHEVPTAAALTITVNFPPR